MPGFSYALSLSLARAADGGRQTTTATSRETNAPRAREIGRRSTAVVGRRSTAVVGDATRRVGVVIHPSTVGRGVIPRAVADARVERRRAFAVDDGAHESFV